MASRFYLGVDQGTTGTTAMIFDDGWNISSRGYTVHKQHYPKPGWVEHDPIEIWTKTKESIASALAESGLLARELRAIGLDNQGETCMAWDRNTGKPIYNAIVWQDRRTARMADALKQEQGEMITQKTGLQVDAYFSALKIKWILDNVEDAWRKAEKGDLLVGTLDTWLLWKLTGGQVYVTDPSTASRTMLFNLKTGQWDDEILDIIGIPKSILPE
ncbi:glycerol kinase, partial [bacterium]|nr:glycerol kinase [bacterium]